VHFVARCESARPHPFDLEPNDRITFVPSGDSGYEVSVTSGAALYDPGTTRVSVAGNGSTYLSYPGFSFPVPGQSDAVSTLVLDEDGLLTSRTSPDYPGVDDNGSPWYMKGQLLLSNRFTIGALMKDLDSNRLVVTYKEVPAAGTTQPNTLQVAINGSGKIEMTVGGLAPTGAGYSPAILGTIGIAAGGTKASQLRDAGPTRFGELRDKGPVFMPFGKDGAIYEQFYVGTGAPCD
jgi:hypothetical protein